MVPLTIIVIGVVTDARPHRAAFNWVPVDTVTTAPPWPPVTPAWAAKPSILAGRITPSEEATLLEDLLEAGTLLGATEDLGTLLGAIDDTGVLLGAADDLLLAGTLLGATEEEPPTMP